jgi:hypothetical protein
VADKDKNVQPERPERLDQRQKGLDRLVTVDPPADAMSPQDAVAKAEPPPQDAKE